MTDRYDNKVRLWSNSSDNIKAPQMTGSGMVNGQKVQVSAWYRTTEKGVVLDLTFGPPRQQGQQRGDYQQDQRPQRDADSYSQDLDDNLPF